MNRYLIYAIYPQGPVDRQSQELHKAQFIQAGLGYTDYVWSHGEGNASEERQYWNVKCTEEQLTMLRLMNFHIASNLTKNFRKEGLAKLTGDEKEALGLGFE